MLKLVQCCYICQLVLLLSEQKFKFSLNLELFVQLKQLTD